MADTKFNLGDVEKQMEDMSEHIVNIHDRTIVEISVSGKTLNTAFYADYPTGYTHSNCHIGYVSYYYGGGSEMIPGFLMYANTNLKIDILGDSTGIKVTPVGGFSTWTGSKLYVELIKN